MFEASIELQMRKSRKIEGLHDCNKSPGNGLRINSNVSSELEELSFSPKKTLIPVACFQTIWGKNETA